MVGARGIIEKTMAIVLGPVISTPKSGSLQATQRPSSFLTSWGCGEVTTGSFVRLGILSTDRRHRELGQEGQEQVLEMGRVGGKGSLKTPLISLRRHIPLEAESLGSPEMLAF